MKAFDAQHLVSSPPGAVMRRKVQARRKIAPLIGWETLVPSFIKRA